MQNQRSTVLFFCVVAMIPALFLSRAALSVSIFVVVVMHLFSQPIKAQWENLRRSPLAIGMILLFLFPLLTGCWSEDRSQWLANLRVKLPLLLLPWVFVSVQLDQKKKKILAIVLLVAVVAGTAWSLFHYANHFVEVNEGYLRAKTLRTPLDDDHVRFSWIVALAVWVAVWLGLQYRSKKWLAGILWLLAGWLFVFLHILAARTGLVTFYASAAMAAPGILVKSGRKLAAAGVWLFMAAIPVLAYCLLPTFRNKVKYFTYDYGYFREAHYLRGGNDAMRVISIRGGWETMKAHPVAGTGFGDLQREMDGWYENTNPAIEPLDRILPSSEWLIYGAAGGVPGLLVFLAVMLLPFFEKVKNRAYWWVLNLVTAAGFLFDIGLEVQFGVFIYVFTLLLARRWLNTES